MRQPVPPKPTPSRDESALEILGDRLYVPLRTSIAQTGRGKDAKPSRTLPGLVKAGERAFDQYMLTVSAASSSLPHTMRQPTGRLARASGRSAGEPGMRAVNRAFGRLAELGLVSLDRSTRPPAVTLLREDGSGEPYTLPGRGGATGERWCKVPRAYWGSGLHRELDLPAKALLIVALTLDDYFWLPRDRGPAWYGLSESTVQRGLQRLVKENILDAYPFWKPVSGGQREHVIANRYLLQAPFGPHGRIARGARKDLAHVQALQTDDAPTVSA